MKQGSKNLSVRAPGAGLPVLLLELMDGSAGEEAGFL